ncbi:MAG: hypothetical protein ACRYG2_28050 [Janthinobacterium lividum]
MPARQGKQTQQPKDAYAQTGKALASEVQRLRGWLGTDASTLPDLVDALNALVAHRLDGHAYAAAGADAQDAVKRSADLLLSTGPIGPYSSATDAVRCGTALVQLAALQVAVGLVDAAGATLDSWDGIRTQVAEAGTVVELAPAAGRRALTVAARVALAGGDVATTNAYADAALAVGGPPPAETGFGAVDLDRLASDARWAAGLTEQSLGFLHTAREAYEEAVGERLADPGRLAPALAERLTEPMPGLYRDLADRLGAVGERDLALASRRQLVARLHAFARRSEVFQAPLVAALTDLASDLAEAGRAEEASDVATEAHEAAADQRVSAETRLLAAAALENRAVGMVVGGDGSVTWSPLDPARAYGAPVAESGGTAPAVPTWLEQERAEARRQEAERADEARRDAEARAAEEARTQQASLAEAVARAAAEAQGREREEARRLAADEADQAERKRRREERLREHRAEVDARENAGRAVRRDEIDVRLAELDAAEEPERDRLLAERAGLDEPGSAPGSALEPALAPVETPDSEPPPARAPEPESEPTLESSPEPTPASEPPTPEPDDLELADQALAQARVGGGRREVRAAMEVVVEVLRTRHAQDAAAYGDRLRASLEELSSARLRGGDLFGARAASREAKALR